MGTQQRNYNYDSDHTVIMPRVQIDIKSSLPEQPAPTSFDEAMDRFENSIVLYKKSLKEFRELFDDNYKLPNEV